MMRVKNQETFVRGLNTFIIVGVIAIVIVFLSIVAAVAWSSNIVIISTPSMNNLTEYEQRQNDCLRTGILFLKPTDPNYRDYDECMGEE